MIRISLVLTFTSLFFAGCIPLNYNATAQIYRDKSNIKQSILITGQPRKRFQSVWGPPTRTYSRFFRKGGAEGWEVGGIGGFKVNEEGTYDMWFYSEKKVTLVFQRDRLIYWHWGPEPPSESKTYETDKIR
jgi:hypothetical protein